MTDILDAKKDFVELDVKVLGENEKNIVTYSLALTLPVTRFCKNACVYCNFSKNESLVIPYSTIKHSKLARNKGAREIYLVGGERPDTSQIIRTDLDLWGFNSYVDYLYNLAEKIRKLISME